MGVGATFWFPGEAFLLKFPGLQHPFADGLRRLGAFFAAEFLIFGSGRLDVNVDPVEQWPGAMNLSLPVRKAQVSRYAPVAPM